MIDDVMCVCTMRVVRLHDDEITNICEGLALLSLTNSLQCYVCSQLRYTPKACPWRVRVSEGTPMRTHIPPRQLGVYARECAWYRRAKNPTTFP